MRVILALGLLAFVGFAAAAWAIYPVGFNDLYCEVLTTAETRAASPTFRRMHFAYCASLSTGSVVGALIRRNGLVVCNETGYYDFTYDVFARSGGTCPYPVLTSSRVANLVRTQAKK